LPSELSLLLEGRESSDHCDENELPKRGAKIMKTRIFRKALSVSAIVLCAVTFLSYSAYAGTQEVKGSPAKISLVSGQGEQIELIYDVLDGNKKTTLLGLRIHYDSTVIEKINFIDPYGEGLLAYDTEAQDDLKDGDNNIKTDKYLGIAWLGVAGNWPGLIELPFILSKMVIKSRPGLSGVVTNINISSSGSPVGYKLQSSGIVVTIP
jgi:hypothetical protein